MGSDLTDYIRAAPLNAISALGLGPLARRGGDPTRHLAALHVEGDGVGAAVDSAGTVGRLFLSVVVGLGGRATAEQITFQTRTAEPSQITGAIGRLTAAGLLTADQAGGVTLAPRVASRFPPSTVSMADPNLMTADALGFVCRALHVKPPARKQERYDAVVAAFDDPATRKAIRAELSDSARLLLERIVGAAGPHTIDPEQVGIHRMALRSASIQGHSALHAVPPREAAALYELTSRGIVGVREWDSQLWVWREAWPVVDRPYYAVWPNVPVPTTRPVTTSPNRVPAIVSVCDRALRLWTASPPPVLKNGDARLAKTDIRNTAKSLGVSDVTVGLVARLIIGIGLVLANTVAETGRGRARSIEQVWLADRAVLDHWNAMPAAARWLRMLREWCRPTISCGDQLLANRHLVVWELSCLDDGVGYGDVAAFVEWVADRYAYIGHVDAIRACVEDLRALGVVAADGPLAITALAATAFRDQRAVLDLFSSDARAAIVQADLTVITPPDFQFDLANQLGLLADVESDAGAVVYRLSAKRIALAVRGGDTADSIIDFLAGISSVELADSVVRLVHDAAAGASRTTVIAAPTVVIVADAADLVTACAIKAAHLTKVSDTVAVSDLPHAKVRAALERRGLAPEVILGGGSRVARSSLDEAERHARHAQLMSDVAARRSSSYAQAEARRLAGEAAALSNVAARLASDGPLALTPASVETLRRR